MKKSTTFLVLIIVIFSCSNKEEDIRKKFGEAQNAVRVKLNLVPIDPHLLLKEDPSVEGRRYIFVHEKEEELKSPDFLRKIILLDSAGQQIDVEEDLFKHPGENKYLIHTRYYYKNESMIVLEFPGGSEPLSNLQADSTLKSWKVDHNPFGKH